MTATVILRLRIPACYAYGYGHKVRDDMAAATYERTYYSYHWLLQLQSQVYVRQECSAKIKTVSCPS